jgi:hypothetical protein
MAAAPPAEHLPDSDAALAALATKATRALLAQSTPAARRASKKSELGRLASVVKEAGQQVDAHQGTPRGVDSDAAEWQQTLQVLARAVQDAKEARTAFAKLIPGEPDFLSCALDAVREHITAEEEMELTSQQHAVVVQAVWLEVNKDIVTPARSSYAPLPPSFASCDILIIKRKMAFLWGS